MPDTEPARCMLVFGVRSSFSHLQAANQVLSGRAQGDIDLHAVIDDGRHVLAALHAHAAHRTVPQLPDQAPACN